MRLKELNSVFFLGIGGIGMSALARYFHELGADVKGYDKVETALTKALVEEGISVVYDDSTLPGDFDCVVYTPAIPKNNGLWQEINDLGIPTVKRAEVLGWISRDQYTIAVAGTHGKTSVSGLITHLLKDSGYDCTGFVGGILRGYQSNYIKGRKDVVVVEADEFDRSFLHLLPDVLVVTSLDPDHLDIYGDFEEMKSTFMQLLQRVKANGRILLHEEVVKKLGELRWSMLLDIALERDQSVDIYGFSPEADFASSSVEVVRCSDGISRYQYMFSADFQEVGNVQINVPGKHNVDNTTAALAVTHLLNIEWQAMERALSNFEGINRRFNYVAQNSKGVVYVDDYAHHPSELAATFDTVKELYPKKSLLAIFQPHLFTRTQDFEHEFAEVLSKVDELLLLDIYPARELPIEGVTSANLLAKVKSENKKLVNSQEVLSIVKNRTETVILTVGAGSIDRLIEPIKQEVSNG